MTGEAGSAAWKLQDAAYRVGHWILLSAVALIGCFASRRISEALRRMLVRQRLLPGPKTRKVIAIGPGRTVPTATDLRWKQRVDELVFDALPRVRATAEKWTASITAVTGVFGLFTLIKGREKIEDLTQDYQRVVGVLLGLALLLALRAIVLAALAAQGTPSWFTPTVAGVRAWFQEEAAEAAASLRYSRVLTVLAVLAAGTAVGFTWFGPVDEPPAARTLLVAADGDVACGKAKVGPGPFVQITLDKPEGVVKRIPLADVRGAFSVPRCD